MSLQVWLPLNGSLDEKISNQSVIAPGSLSLPSATTDGKLGAGYTFLNSGIKITNVIATSEMSFAMWVKMPQENFGSCHLLDFRVWDGSIGYQPIYFDSASNSIQIHSSKNNVNGNRPVDLTDYQWHHLTVTMNSNNCRLYVDGTLSGEPLSGLEMYDNAITDLNIGCRCNATSTCSGLIQDVRIYDHCLSPREVKLLAQGLVAHYKLDDSYLESTTNLLNGVWTHTNFWEAPLGTYSALSTQLNGGACEVVEFNNIKCLRFQKLPGEEQGRIFSTYPIKANKTYTVSLDYYASSTHYNALKVELNGGDYYWTPLSCSYSNPNQWKRLSITITPTSDTTLYIFAYGNINEYTYINNIQLEEKDHATSYTPSSRNNNIAYDCSGYGNHGTTSASFGLASGDTPRYKNCTIFENNKYINCGRGSMITDALTISMWAYMDDWSTASSYRLISCAQEGGWDIWPNSNKYMTMELYRNDKYITGISETPFTDTTGKWKTGWHHIVGTYDGYKAEFYLDGVKGTTSEISDIKYPITYHSSNSLFIGAEAGESATTPDAIYFNGKMSDVRIYATALSAAAVKELYQSSISFLDNGTLQCSEIVENSTNLKYNQNGIVQAELISEVGYTNKMKTKTLSDGSAWARIHWLDVSNDATYFANEAEVQECTDKTNRFSLMKYVDKFKSINNNYEFMLTYPKISATGYNRWTQTSSPNKTGSVENVIHITTSWNTYNGGIRKYSGDAAYHCSGDSGWYAPIGQHKRWTLNSTSQIPASNGNSTTETELWIRIDNLSKLTKLSMFNGALQAHQIYEL